MIIEGQILPVGRVEHLTDIAGNAVQLDLRDPAHVAAIVESINAHIARVRPPLLREHKRDGLRRGEVLEALVGKDPDTGVEGIRVRVRVDDPELIRDAALIKRFSPFLVTQTKASDGTLYPYGLAEVSTVSVPMSDADQPDVLIAAASQIGALRDDESSAILAKSVEPSAILAQAPEDSMIDELLAALQAATPEQLAAFRTLLSPPPAAVTVDAAAPPVPAPAPVPASAPMDPMQVAMAAAVANAIGPLAAKVDRLIAGAPQTAPGSIAAAAIHRGAMPGPSSAPVKRDPNARALELQRAKGITYVAALTEALAEA